MQLRRRRPITPRPPRRHVQRGGDRRARRRLPDPHAVLAAAVNDRLVARHVLHRPLRRRDQRLLDRSAIAARRPSPTAPTPTSAPTSSSPRARPRSPARPPAGPSSSKSAWPCSSRASRLSAPGRRSCSPVSHMLPLQHRDQIVALDRLTAPHAELRERVIGAEPQRRGGPLGAALEPVARRAGSRCARTPPAPPPAPGDSRPPAPRRRGCRPRPRLWTASAPVPQFI